MSTTTEVPESISARTDRNHVTIDEYARFRRDGLVVIRNLVGPDDIAELRQHTDDLMQGRLPEQRTQMPERDVTKDDPM